MENETTLTEVLDAVNKGFTHVQTQIQGLDGKIHSLDGKIQGLDGKIQGLEVKVQGLDGKIQGLDKKIDGVEKRLEKKIDVLTEHIDGFAKKQLDFEAELAAERSARERLEERIA